MLLLLRLLRIPIPPCQWDLLCFYARQEPKISAQVSCSSVACRSFFLRLSATNVVQDRTTQQAVGGGGGCITFTVGFSDWSLRLSRSRTIYSRTPRCRRRKKNKKKTHIDHFLPTPYVTE